MGLLPLEVTDNNFDYSPLFTTINTAWVGEIGGPSDKLSTIAVDSPEVDACP